MSEATRQQRELGGKTWEMRSGQGRGGAFRLGNLALLLGRTASALSHFSSLSLGGHGCGLGARTSHVPCGEDQMR